VLRFGGKFDGFHVQGRVDDLALTAVMFPQFEAPPRVATYPSEEDKQKTGQGSS